MNFSNNIFFVIRGKNNTLQLICKNILKGTCTDSAACSPSKALLSGESCKLQCSPGHYMVSGNGIVSCPINSIDNVSIPSMDFVCREFACNTSSSGSQCKTCVEQCVDKCVKHV